MPGAELFAVLYMNELMIPAKTILEEITDTNLARARPATRHPHQNAQHGRFCLAGQTLSLVVEHLLTHECTIYNPDR